MSSVQGSGGRLLLQNVGRFLTECGFSTDDKEVFMRCLRHQMELAQKSHEISVQLLNKLKSSPLNNLVSIIDARAPISNRHFIISDIKVKCRGPDDRLYARHPELQQTVPRGFAMLFESSVCDSPADASVAAAGRSAAASAGSVAATLPQSSALDELNSSTRRKKKNKNKSNAKGVVGSITEDENFNSDVDRLNIAETDEVVPTASLLSSSEVERRLREVVIYANRKFTGGIGDEDDQQPETNEEWKKTFLEDHNLADFIVSMEKINGEAAHFSGRYIDNEFYLFVGSKNVHMMIKDQNDITSYDDENARRYLTAVPVAKAVWSVISSLSEEKRLLLQQFLHHSKVTLACELLQRTYQHIVRLDHLPANQIKVIAAYFMAEDASSLASLTAFPVHLMLKFFRGLGFDTPEFEIVSNDEQTLANYIRDLRGRHKTEGRVLYYVCQPDLRTVGMMKLKTVWYVMVRAIREKIMYYQHNAVKDRSISVANLHSKMESRIKSIQKWLRISDCATKRWIELAKKFFLFVEDMLGDKFVLEELKPCFPQIWENFVQSDDSNRDNFENY